MIRESHIDENINRLMSHFRSRVVCRPPATAADLAAVEDLAGALPRDLTIFLATTNGLRVELQDHWMPGHLWSTHEMTDCLQSTVGPAAPPGLVPITGVGGTQRDWIVLQPGELHGAVVRCDPWGGDDAIVASTFGTYLEAWTNYLLEHFDPAGRPMQESPRIPFDGEYVAPHDSDLRRLQADFNVQAWLGDLQMSVSGGADFE